MSADSEISKFLSYVLRHAPEAAGLVLEPGGWVTVDALLAGAAARNRPIDRVRLLSIVAGSDKKRFTLSDDGTRIRAAQGHSVPVDLDLAPKPPPETLFHGTASRFLDAILSEGLKPGSRQQVHLSADAMTATAVGARHGKPIVLLVQAGAMHAAGHRFFQADNGVWLVDAVPARFLSLADAAA